MFRKMLVVLCLSLAVPAGARSVAPQAKQPVPVTTSRSVTASDTVCHWELRFSWADWPSFYHWEQVCTTIVDSGGGGNGCGGGVDDTCFPTTPTDDDNGN